MAELAIVAPEGPQPRPGQDLTVACADVVVRLATLIEESCAESEERDSAVGLLRMWAEHTDADGPTPLPTLTPRTPLDRLVSGLGLSAADRDLLLLSGLVEEHPGFGDVMRLLHPTGLPCASVMLAARLLASGGRGPDHHAIIAESVALRTGLLELGPGATSFERSMTVAEGLWPTLRGYDVLPDTLRRVDLPAPPPGLGRWLADDAPRRAVSALTSPEASLITLRCPDRMTGLGRVAALTQASGRPTLAVRIGGSDPSGWQQLRLHALTRDAVPVVVADGDLDIEEAAASTLYPGPLVLCTVGQVTTVSASVPLLDVPCGQVDAEAITESWAAAVPDLRGGHDVLAGRFRLDPAHTQAIGADLREWSALDESGPVTIGQVAAAIRTRFRRGLPDGATLETPSVDWSRLVVGAETRSQLADALSRLQHQRQVLDRWNLRGTARADRGVRLLFTGLPGTGKTLAVEAMASAAGLDVLSVDLSGVLSRWLGETEARLGAMFDAAERTQAILFMDEADALFGNRTEVTDAHERYANVQTSYLLQRLNRFDGILVLATNLRQNVDPAFIRRIDHVIDFPLPGAPERARLWELHLPAGRLADDLDLAALGHRYAVPGGWIRNAAIAAAFLAAADGSQVRRAHVVTALQREYDKVGKPFPRSSQTTCEPDQQLLASDEAFGIDLAKEGP